MIFGWIKSACKAVAKHSGKIAAGLATCAVAAGTTFLTGGAALPAWLMALLPSISAISIAGAFSFTIHYVANTSGNTQNSVVTK